MVVLGEVVLLGAVVPFDAFCWSCPESVVEGNGGGAGALFTPRTVIDTLLVRLHHFPRVSGSHRVLGMLWAQPCLASPFNIRRERGARNILTAFLACTWAPG